ncbi:MAG: Hsp20/alpha crystallin family protein [bacterium]|nr:Hsp20/alpha crystallin family protein [bacterium]MDZ4284757.1 Hsp20/alpha crystallin family protein [Patescibacteria group bacterium]
MSKRSFLERLTGARHKVINEDDEGRTVPLAKRMGLAGANEIGKNKATLDTDSENAADLLAESREGQLAVDVYQTPSDIVVKTMVAGVKPDEIDIVITRDMLTIRGSRSEARTISEDDYLHRELYWGTFSRTVLLPAEVDPDSAEAMSRQGLLIIKLPKLDKDRQTKLKVRPA